MRIAVPTNDSESFSEHFESREVRTNAARHSHAQGSCGDGSGRHEPHGHEGILWWLPGCDVVICAGKGRRAAEALKSEVYCGCAH